MDPACENQTRQDTDMSLPCPVLEQGPYLAVSSLHNNRTMLTGSQDKKCGSSEALLRALSFLIYTHHIKSSHTMTTCKLPSLYNPSTS